MLWGKNRKDPKIGDISPKGHTVVNRQFVAGVAVTLIVCIALLMSGGVSQVFGKTLLVEPEFMEVTKFEFVEVTKPEFSVPTVSSDGLTIWGGEQKSVEYLMCAPLKGFPTPKKCLFEGQ